ncbi:MAG: Tn3 family transposase [Gammaproteobacteria bacterium]|nr:Tn3 family transposase [Gammaproteobacteria bacterium]MCW5584016.1 Tn3 family transposase [Gammaproteobacteria bacterium]
MDGKILNDSITACEQLSIYQTSGFYRTLENKYNDLRKYMPHLFELEFKGAAGTKSILKSIEILRDLNCTKSDVLPDDAPTDFIPKIWMKAMYDNQNIKLSRRTWEMALYYALKNNLERGDIYVSHSKKHRYFWNTVYSEDQWEKEKPLAFKSLGFPEKFDKLLSILKKEYFAGIDRAKCAFHERTFAYIDSNGKLKLKREDALEVPESVKTLKKLIEEKMQPIRIETVLRDLDEAHQFTRFFLPPEGFDKRFMVDRETLHTAITAMGTNLGFDDMAKSTVSAISEEKLKHMAQWCIRPDVLTKTNYFFVSKRAEHPLAKLHGDFSRSSSDAECFCIQKSTDLASFYPKAFGYYQKVIAIHTHMSDQFSVFNTQVISCGVREASYVLDGLLNNLMVLTPHFHCTDTGGFTHQLFALCYLLGFSFQPRLKDLTETTLYKINKNDNYGEIDSIFDGHIDMDCISEQWEQLIRIVVSLKNHVAPAHLILQKLAARGSTDRVAKAVMELGKLIKTIYILHYLSDDELRRKVQLQLNRGETRHYLARHIFFGNQGEFKTADYEEMMNIASCLSLLSNAVLLWNTPRIYDIVSELRSAGISIDDEDLKRVSPLMFKHLIVHGTYDFRSANRPVVDYASNL